MKAPLQTESFGGGVTYGWRGPPMAQIAEAKPQSACEGESERITAAGRHRGDSLPDYRHYLAAPPFLRRVCQKSNIET